MIGHVFTDWARLPAARRDHRTCSPNLDQLRNVMRQRWQFTSLGCYGPRPIAGTTKPSNHSWGAAVDIGYPEHKRLIVEGDVLAYLIGWSDEWNISAIHDYRGSRIWRAGRTPNEMDCCDLWWKAQKRDSGGMGQPWGNWLHIEVTEQGWDDDRDEGQRGIR